MRKVWGQTKPLKGALLNGAHPLSKGLVACWLFNEGSGNKIFDSCGGRNNGVFSGISTPATSTSGWHPGKFGKAVLLDGSDDYITTPTSPTIRYNLKNQITFEAWVKINSTSADWAPIIFQRGASATGLDVAGTTGYLRVYITGSLLSGVAVDGTSNIRNNKWTHVAGVYDGSLLRAYVNGRLENSNFGICGNLTDAAAYLIGFDSVAGARKIKGLMETIRIWNRALSAREILTLYKSPFCMFDR